MEIDYDFKLELTPNIYGMHENGKIQVNLCCFNFREEDINIAKIVKVLRHETFHAVFREILTDEELQWANQERIIGLLESMDR
jgi:hypothetical protein